MRIIRKLIAESELSLDSDEILAGAGMLGKDFVELQHQVQDKYSIRCAPHVTGALRDTLAWVRRWMEIEINASATTRCSIGAGRYAAAAFLRQPPGAGDGRAEGRAGQRLRSDGTPARSSSSTRSLTWPDPEPDPVLRRRRSRGGDARGFKGMQLCCSAMAAEAIKLSNPASVHSRSTECHNQDKVSMGTIAARDARSIVELAQNVAAVHLIAVCQALDLRGPEKASAGTRPCTPSCASASRSWRPTGARTSTSRPRWS